MKLDNNLAFTIISLLVTLYQDSNNVHCENGNLVITINTGKIKGAVLVSTEGKKYNAFTGIPFAKPPVKELRFKPPQPLEPWDGIYDATQNGEVCPQLQLFSTNFHGNENCLFLNVYTPENYVGKSYPVLFYIHGGGYVMGGSAFKALGPEKYMNLGDVVIVTINYRLGVLGFVSTGDENAPGNYGMLDQVLALKWVQENIGNFGGDPAKVTIFGMSAGGSSVALLVMSPLTKGLFHAAIAQSGTTMGSWCVQRKPLYWAMKIAEKLNCPTVNTKEMIECFKEASVETLVKAEADLHLSPMFPIYMAPVIESSGGEGFLTEDPMVSLKEGRIPNKIPYITGITQDEGDIFMFLGKMAFKTNGQEFFDNEFPSELLTFYVPQVEDYGTKEIAKAIQKEYFGNEDVNDQQVFEKGFTTFVADSMFVVGAQVTLDLMTKAGVPTYAYIYKYHSKPLASLMQTVLKANPDKIHHGSEGYIQFRMNPTREMEIETSEDDNIFSKIINTVWKNFADRKKPSFEGTSIENESLDWPLYSTEKPYHMEININPKLNVGYFTNRTKFWTEVIPKLAQNQKDEL